MHWPKGYPDSISLCVLPAPPPLEARASLRERRDVLGRALSAWALLGAARGLRRRVRASAAARLLRRCLVGLTLSAVDARAHRARARCLARLLGRRRRREALGQWACAAREAAVRRARRRVRAAVAWAFATWAEAAAAAAAELANELSAMAHWLSRLLRRWAAFARRRAAAVAVMAAEARGKANAAAVLRGFAAWAQFVATRRVCRRWRLRRSLRTLARRMLPAAAARQRAEDALAERRLRTGIAALR